MPEEKGREIPLDSTIIIALIAAASSVLTGILALVGVMLTGRQQARDMGQNLYR